MMLRWMIPLTLLVGCDDHIFSGGAGHSAVVPEGGGYEAVQAIVDAQCVACHGGSGGLSLDGNLCDVTVNVQANGYSGTLIVPGDHSTSVFWHKSANTGDYGQGMPIPGGVSAEEAQIMADWIDAGASCDSTVVEPASEPSSTDTGIDQGEYAAIVATLQPYGCAGSYCHGGMGPDLSDHGEVMAAMAGDYMSQSTEVDGVMPWITPNEPENSYLYHKIAGTHLEGTVNGGGQSMPTGGFVTGGDLQVVSDWIMAGAPE